MKSTLFSVLKIVVIAMMLVWALQPAGVQALTGCSNQQFGQCMNVCGNAMSQCANRCYQGYPPCIQACMAVLNSCQSQCAAQYCQ